MGYVVPEQNEKYFFRYNGDMTQGEVIEIKFDREIAFFKLRSGRVVEVPFYDIVESTKTIPTPKTSNQGVLFTS